MQFDLVEAAGPSPPALLRPAVVPVRVPAVGASGAAEPPAPVSVPVATAPSGPEAPSLDAASVVAMASSGTVADHAHVEDGDDQAICVICQDVMRPQGAETMALFCGHRFHKLCVLEWRICAGKGERDCPYRCPFPEASGNPAPALFLAKSLDSSFCFLVVSWLGLFLSHAFNHQDKLPTKHHVCK